MADMGPLPIALLLFLVGPLWAAGPSRPKEKPVCANFLGEGNCTQHTPESNRAFETTSPDMSVAPKPKEKSPPPEAFVRREESRPGAMPARLAKIASGKAEVKAEEPAGDAADRSGQRLYDGAADHLQALKKAPETKPEPQMAAVPEAAPPDIFVAVDLDLKANPDQYKDAVASLGRVAAFRPDPRFAPAAPSPDRISFWGWMPANRVAEALAVSGVMRLHLDHSRPWAAALSMPDPASGRFLVSIRVPDQAGASEAADKVVEQLAGLGFQPLRSAGTETAAGGELAFVVEGLLPVRALSLVLRHAQVLRVVPVRPEQAAAPKDASPKGFLVYVADRAPFLLVITLLLLLLPRLSGGWDKLCEIFIPYRR
jgi:hypothetical protein